MVKQIQTENIRVGVAIPAFNRVAHTLACLESLKKSTKPLSLIVVVDDGSTDNTSERIRENYPEVHILKGNGNLWWTESTNLAVKYCINANCDYILLLNQDCIVESLAVEHLLAAAKEDPNAIYAAVNIYRSNVERLHWLGTYWQPIPNIPFVYKATAIKVPQMLVQNLPNKPIKCDMTGARGVLVPAKVFQQIGLFDSANLPQYGADNDFMLRVRGQGINIWVVPDALIQVEYNESVVFSGKGSQGFFKRTRSLLLERRNGEAAHVWWILARRHTPWWATLPTYTRMILLTLKRGWQESRH